MNMTKFLKQENTIIALLHLSTLIPIGLFSTYSISTNSFFIAPAALGIISPLILWKFYSASTLRKRHHLVVLNWMLTVILLTILFLPFALIYIGMYLLLGLNFLTFIFSILGSILAYKGKVWKYPLTINFFKKVSREE